jgi:Condensation domain.
VVKKLIITERTNLFEPNDAIAMKFTILGQVEANRIITAFNAAVKANETLCSKVVLSENGDAWYELVKETHNFISIKDQDWMTVLEEQQKILFRIDQGELIRGFLFPGKEQSEVLLLAHHLAGDGKAIVYFIEQFMNALNEEDIPYKSLRTISVDEIPEKKKIGWSIGLYLRYWNRQWRKVGRSFSMEDRRLIHHLYWNKNQMSICCEHFSAKELEHLLSKAKKAQVSLTSYIITAFAKEIPEKIAIGIAIDGRLDKNRNLGNQTSGTEIVYRYHSGKSFQENAQRFQRILKRILSRSKSKYFVLYFMGKLQGSLIDSIYMQLSGEYHNHVSKSMAKICGYEEGKRYYSFTNLMKLDIPDQYGKYKICDFIFIPPHISYGKRLIGIATLNQEMNLSYQLISDKNTEWEMNRFNKIMEELKK